MPLLASEVLDEARKVYLNDPDAEKFDNTALLPLLSKAYDELQNELNINTAKEVEEVSSLISVLAASTTLTLPSDYVSPIKLEERPAGSSESFIEVDKISELPDQEAAREEISYWIDRENEIKLGAPTTNREVRFTYVKSLTPITGTGTSIPIIGSKTFLAARTAELAARFVGHNTTLSMQIAVDSENAKSLLTRTSVKNSQRFSVRRRRFRAGA